MFQLKMSAASCEAECEDFVINVPLLEPADQCCESSIVKEAECEDFDINNIPPAEWQKFCIYRVPKQLRKVNKEAYTPKLVSIGPFHHRRKELRDMEKHKRVYLEDFLKWTSLLQQDLESIIEAKEKEIRLCYSDDCRLNSKDFVQMILLDAIFIIQLFLKKEDARSKGRKAEEEKDYILSKPWLLNGIYYDLILLENQLPFFVLEDLYTSAFNDSSSLSHQQEGQQIMDNQGDLNKEDIVPFLKLSRCFFFGYDIDEKQDSNTGGQVKHFTDLVRYFLLNPSPGLKPTGEQYSTYSATKLDKAGLQFKAVGLKEDRGLLDIRFLENKCLNNCPCFNLSWLLACLPCLKCFPCLKGMQRLLEVPCFTVDDHTECLFRNIMALEQCCYPSKAYICNYVVLLDHLINTEEDVALLVDKEVILNLLGSNAVVADLINNLCNEIVLDETCYSTLAEELKNYHDNSWNRNMASMTSVYFHDFWRGTATVVGLIVLGLTIWNFFK